MNTDKQKEEVPVCKKGEHELILNTNTKLWWCWKCKKYEDELKKLQPNEQLEEVNEDAIGFAELETFITDRFPYVKRGDWFEPAMQLIIEYHQVPQTEFAIFVAKNNYSLIEMGDGEFLWCNESEQEWTGKRKGLLTNNELYDLYKQSKINKI